MRNTNLDQGQGRRKIVKLLATGGATTTAICSQWTKPAVDSVLLPVHASVSGVAPGDELFGTETLIQIVANNDNSEESNRIFSKLVDGVIPKAYAFINVTEILEISAAILEDNQLNYAFKFIEIGECEGGMEGGLANMYENSGFVSGSADLDNGFSTTANWCFGGGFPVDLLFQVIGGYLYASGTIFNKTNFNVMLMPGNTVPVATPCIGCMGPGV